MEPGQSGASGFPLHIQEQLNQAAQQVLAGSQLAQRSRGRGRGPSRSRGNRGQSHVSHLQPGHDQFQVTQPPLAQPAVSTHRGPQQYETLRKMPPATPSRERQNIHSSTEADRWSMSMSPPPSDSQSFPPLGSATTSLPKRQQQRRPNNQQPKADVGPSAPSQARTEDSFDRSRGNVYRSGPPPTGRARNQNQGRPQYSQPQMIDSGDFQRLQSQNAHLYNPTNNLQATYNNPQKFRQMVMLQSDFLNHVAQIALQCQIGRTELEDKETFRKELEGILQDMVAKNSPESVTVNPRSVILKCYGSLANGFGVRGSDMDLLLMFPSDEGPTGDFEVESRRMLEKAFLDIGYGARLLTNTRVPILRVCQKPGAELLENLRKNREKWEEEVAEAENPKIVVDEQLSNRFPDKLSSEQSEAAARLFAELEDAPSDIPLPPSPQREHAHLEYKGDCGIQCDINFSNFVAIHNTKLLKCYCQQDNRVREMGIFVKAWAKARDINTPYHGTLSSYGYILMVLHYLMNIANPPVIPNLQHMARDEDAWANKTDVALFEGFDVRFVSEQRKIAQFKERLRPNHESLGSLIRGFFWYYGHQQGFHWTQQVVSIRTKGGILRKYQKGWTEAKFAEGNNNIRLRYLLCIEDPFETEHNIARTVGHNGLVSIRDEFRRGWKIIERAERSSAGWEWKKDSGELGEDFMERVVDRGDLLRQDQDYHRQKLKKMKEDMDAKAKALRVEESLTGESGENQEAPGEARGMSSDPNSCSEGAAEPPNGNHRSSPKLTRIVGNFQDNLRQSKCQTRRLKNESDDEESAEDDKLDIEQGVGDSDQYGSEDNIANQADSSTILQDMGASMHLYSGYAATYALHGLGAIPKPEPWDITTEQGRFLEWRDNKIRNGAWRPETNQPTLRQLDEQFPFDSRRPAGDPSYGIWRGEEIYPPWPACAPEKHDPGTTSYPAEDEGPKSQMANAKAAWDIRTAGGRWLVWRDGEILAGRYPGDDKVREKQLAEAFPYNPSISVAELDRKNDVLRQHYRNRTYVFWRNFKSIVEPLLLSTGPNKESTKIDSAGASANPVEIPESTNDRSARVAGDSENRGTAPAMENEGIAWDRNTFGGRWLRARDRRIRSGTWLPTNVRKMCKNLDLAFPYKTTISAPELETRNTILREFYCRSTYVPRAVYSARVLPLLDVKLADSEETKTPTRDPHVVARYDEDRAATPTLLPRPSTTLDPICSTQDLGITETEPDATFIRNQRLAYFAKRCLPEEPQRDPQPVADTFLNVKELMKDAGIDIETQNKSRRVSATTGIHYISMNHSEQVQESKLKRSSLSSPTSTMSPGLEPELYDTLSGPSSFSEPLVPDTLYPGVDGLNRPRDEDPNIMPIPRKIGWQFDQRQLRDLEIIRNGGNGCARIGEEYDIEDDYEWGGGGLMGWKKSSSGQAAFESGGTGGEEWAAGTGDEEGLLGELPGLM